MYYFTSYNPHLRPCVYIPALTEEEHIVLRAAQLYYSTDTEYTPTIGDAIEAIAIEGNCEWAVIHLCKCDFHEAQLLVEIASA